MSQLIEYLRSFDRKERSAVLREAVGIHPETASLDEDFRRELADSIGVDVPERVFLATDYHLDWIELALHRTRNPQIPDGKPFKNPAPERINKNQQDIDLLVAFEETRKCRQLTHLIMIEAKAYLSWINAQLSAKTKRLGKIFGTDGRRYNTVEPRFVLMTAHEPRSIDAGFWPDWTRQGDNPFLLRYDLPRRLEVTRCTEKGISSENGTHLRLHWSPRREARSARRR